MNDRLVPASDPRLPTLHLDVLYVRDDRGRIEHVRSADVPTPLAHFLRTPTGNHWLIGSTIPDDVAARLDTAFADEPVAHPDEWERHPPRCLEVARALLAPFRDGTTEEYRGPAFAFPSDLVPTGAAELYRPGDRLPDVAERLAWIATASEVEHPIVVAHDERGRVVSVCDAARATSEAAAAGLETAAEARRRGHALAVTSRWAVEVRASGREPPYSTWWENEASRAVARRLGLILYAEDWHVG